MDRLIEKLYLLESTLCDGKAFPATWKFKVLLTIHYTIVDV